MKEDKMKKKSYLYQVGTRVAYVADLDEDFGSEGPSEPHYGVITTLVKDDQVVVEWDDEYHRSHYSALVSANDLLPEEEAKADFSRLEKEFSEIVDHLREKMVAAAKLINEAGKFAKKHELNLSEMYDVYDPLYTAMDNAGWNTSSFGC